MMSRNITMDFKTIDTSDFPDFHNFNKPFEMGLWVLWVAKDKLSIRKLSADEISSVIREIKEVSMDSKSITNSFNRSAGKKVHVYKEDSLTKYEIMKAGKDHLKSKEKSINVLYFEPGKKFASKRILSKDILSNLKGELKIIDPYCNKKTLDILEKSGKDKIKLLTKKSSIGNARKQGSFSRELNDLNSDGYDIEVRDYPNNDIHDRYIISDDSFIIIGYSIKDFGKKETFIAIFDDNEDIYNQLKSNFDSKWNISSTI